MTRQPEAVGTRTQMRIAANNVAKARVQAMYEQYGPEMMNAVSAEIIHYTETVPHNRIKEIPDGSWSETLTIEADGPCRLNLTLKNGDQLTFDFTGTDKRWAKELISLITARSVFVSEPSSAAWRTIFPRMMGVVTDDRYRSGKHFGHWLRFRASMSMSTTSSGFGVGFLASSVLMKMLATSQKWRKEIVAPNAYHRNCRHSGQKTEDGRYSPFINMAHCALDGNGAGIAARMASIPVEAT